MSFTANSKRAFGAIAICAALVLPACSSSGGGSGGSQDVTTGQIAAKLKSDSTVTSLKAKLGSQANKFDSIIDCIAGVMHKDIKQSDLKAYVNGDKKISALATTKDKVATDAQNCAKKIVSGS